MNRRFGTGAMVGALTMVLVLFGAPAQARMSGPNDASGSTNMYCASTGFAGGGCKGRYVRNRVHHFHRGDLGRILRGEHVAYPHWIKRGIIHDMIHKSKRYNRGDGKSAWQKFISTDTCITWTDRNGSTWPAVCRNGVQKMRKLNQTEVTALLCGSGIWIGFVGGGGSPIGAGAGGVGCLWDRLWTRRH